MMDGVVVVVVRFEQQQKRQVFGNCGGEDQFSKLYFLVRDEFFVLRGQKVNR